ncbi:hypothetical protein VD0002_g6486 [Verticillium dahliae]|uniref:Major facilitator superfamily (MFS) profile domain-containing protein n=1 Tax=Verticillium dahliae TaxID=27337 RepID=A0AA44WG80_VERDA|nr:polyamine transporter 3 [Verticillium dahliae]PNH30991.1 hypothetical protein BJF96_g5850 [Verticillium dahliae]PNH49396.1 hypothetical protein VD0003_g7757 [Verticillium dahliae]PNH61298.1 hypothetical protein VD0002_g6486 [Verticillium dahliae]
MASSSPDPEKGAGAGGDWRSSTPSLHSNNDKTRSGTERASGHPCDESDSSHDVLEKALRRDTDYEIDEAPGAGEPLSRVRTEASTASRPPDFEVEFTADDPDNPRNWSKWYRAWVMFVVSISCWIVVLYSTSYTASIPGLMEEYNASKSYTALGVTTYLLGLATGSLVVAPLSELYGRRKIYIVCMVLSTIMIIPCALATSLEQMFACRFVGAMFGAALISNSPGTIVDISTEDRRAKYMSLWSIAPLNGPVTGPIIGGFVFQYLGWRWCNWLVLIVAGVSIVMMLTVKETYAPTLLQQKAAKLRKETDDPRWWCRYDAKVSKVELIKTNMSRPFILAATEPILWAANIWISVIYAILYLCFIAYPIVFSEHRGWGPGTSGLAFLGIGIGTLMAIFAEPLLRRIVNAHRHDPATGRPLPESAARIMVLGAILTPLGQLVFSWTCLPVTIHWAIPIAFGIPFGAGNTLSFIYGSNYLAGAYGIYAASALAGNAVIRSIAGGVLPLAGPAMYTTLSPQWAGTLLGLLEVALIPVPLAFWRYGERIRAKSPLIRQMRDEQERLERRKARAEVKREKAGGVQDRAGKQTV